MAFKEIALFSSFVALAIVMNGSHACPTPCSTDLDSMFKTVKSDLYNLQETEFNLMNDSQKFYDIQKEYLAGNIDYAALVQAQKGLDQTRKNWYKAMMKYINDSNDFESAVESAVVNGLPDFYFVNQVNSLNALKASVAPTTPVIVA